MEPAVAIAAGFVFAFALQALLRRNFLRMVIGFMLISNAINLLIFVAGRFTRGEPPIVHGAAHGVYANPLPQALILTAIVISFGITAFAFSLTYRVFKSLGTLDTDSLVEVERLEPVHDEEELSA